MKRLAELAGLHGDGSQRRIVVDERELGYTLRRSARRSIAIRVDTRGVVVHAPRTASLARVEAFVRSHAEWALKVAGLHQRRLRERAFPVVEGACLMVLGRPVRLCLRDGRARERWGPGGDGVEELRLGAANPLGGLERALRQRALEWFRGRVEEYCLRIGLGAPPVALSSARTRWGSCSARSGIRLHWKLVLLPPALADYVIAHEVAHLREMNHSEKFWLQVAALCPDWRARREALREHGPRLPEFVRAGPGDELFAGEGG